MHQFEVRDVEREVPGHPKTKKATWGQLRHIVPSVRGKDFVADLDASAL